MESKILKELILDSDPESIKWCEKHATFKRNEITSLKDYIFFVPQSVKFINLKYGEDVPQKILDAMFLLSSETDSSVGAYLMIFFQN